MSKRRAAAGLPQGAGTWRDTARRAGHAKQRHGHREPQQIHAGRGPRHPRPPRRQGQPIDNGPSEDLSSGKSARESWEVEPDADYPNNKEL
jgi:hypothetical protein